jgi:hypothetical protein
VTDPLDSPSGHIDPTFAPMPFTNDGQRDKNRNLSLSPKRCELGSDGVDYVVGSLHDVVPAEVEHPPTESGQTIVAARVSFLRGRANV